MQLLLHSFLQGFHPFVSRHLDFGVRCHHTRRVITCSGRGRDNLLAKFLLRTADTMASSLCIVAGIGTLQKGFYRCDSPRGLTPGLFNTIWLSILARSRCLRDHSHYSTSISGCDRLWRLVAQRLIRVLLVVPVLEQPQPDRRNGTYILVVAPVAPVAPGPVPPVLTPQHEKQEEVSS